MGAGLVLAALGLIAALVLRTDAARGQLARWRVPRVVVVTLDTLHVDYTGPYNPQVDFTPTLDRFAATGVTFAHAYTTVPITLPSHASLFTGRQPPELGVMINGDVVPVGVDTLAERLRRFGYRTGAVTSLGVLNAPFNLAQGFDHYDDDVGGRWERWYRTADEVVAAARGWVDRVDEDPFLLWLHLSDPHEPYLPIDAPPDARLELDGVPLSEWTLTTKERYRTTVELPPGTHTLTIRSLRERRPDDTPRTALMLEQLELGGALERLPPPLDEEVQLDAPYAVQLTNPGAEPVGVEVVFRGRTNAPPRSEVLAHYPVEVAYTDRWLGEFEAFLAERGLAEDTLWVLVSDHGEGLFRFGSVGHATYTQEDQLQIVWQMRGPGVPAGVRITDAPVLIDDVLPTVLDLLGLPAGEGLYGRSQTGCWGKEGCYARDEWWAFGASVQDERVTALAGYRWPYKLLWQDRRRSGLFNVVLDPEERKELGRVYGGADREAPPEFERLQKMRERHLAALDARLEARAARELSDEQEAMLRALGYIN